MSPKSKQRIVRVSIPLYKQITKRASMYGYTLTEAMTKIIESYERKIKKLESENVEVQDLREFKQGMKPLTDFPCNVCGKPMSNDWNNPNTLKIRDEIIELVIKERWEHSSCHKPK